MGWEFTCAWGLKNLFQDPNTILVALNNNGTIPWGTIIQSLCACPFQSCCWSWFSWTSHSFLTDILWPHTSWHFQASWPWSNSRVPRFFSHEWWYHPYSILYVHLLLYFVLPASRVLLIRINHSSHEVTNTFADFKL